MGTNGDLRRATQSPRALSMIAFVELTVPTEDGEAMTTHRCTPNIHHRTIFGLLDGARYLTMPAGVGGWETLGSYDDVHFSFCTFENL